jgi:diguanylate cyclase (GGDEF)-like protein
VRLISRHDTGLVAALIVGTFVLFNQPLRALLETAGDIQRRYHLDLVQTLILLVVVLAFHQTRKRQEAKAEARTAAAEAQQARLRSEELERLVGLSRALASVNDYMGLSQALWRYLPKFTCDRASWLLICQQGCWDVLLRDTDDRRSNEELEAIAGKALAIDASQPARVDGISIDDALCFPMMAGGNPVGVLIVRDKPGLSLDERRALLAAVSLAGIAVRNVQAFVEARENSLRDGLTGCFNRAHAVDTLHAELKRARRTRASLSMLMFDIDHFKRVNDSYGHLAGDQLLAEVGRRLDSVLRSTDVKCRYGGDEFLIILPETPASGARQLAESLRQELSTIAVDTADGPLTATFSIGVATAGEEDKDAETFVARTDRELYKAKRNGRNRVSSAEPEVVAPLRLVSMAG